MRHEAIPLDIHAANGNPGRVENISRFRERAVQAHGTWTTGSIRLQGKIGADTNEWVDIATINALGYTLIPVGYSHLRTFTTTADAGARLTFGGLDSRVGE